MPDVDILRINGTDYKVHDSDGRALVAPEELTSTATKPHAVGEPFVYDGKLCHATATIAIGDPIVTTGTGANAAQVPGGAMGEVTSLKSALETSQITSDTSGATVTTGKYIYKNGNVETSGAFAYASPFNLTKGQTLVIHGLGSGGNVAMIAQVNQGGTYTPLILDDGSSAAKDYEYTATNNITLAISYNKNTEHAVKIYYKVQANDSLILSDLESYKGEINQLGFFDSVDFTGAIEGKYVTYSNYIDSSAAMAYKNGFFLNKGDRIDFTARGVGTSVAMIATYDGNSYKCVAQSVDSTVRDYYYIAEYPTIIALSYNKNYQHDATITRNPYTNYQDDFGYGVIFDKMAVIGDSLASGELVMSGYTGDVYGDSWLSFIAKQIGAKRNHYSEGGLNCKTWLESYLTKMQSDTAANVYFIALGTNDNYSQPYDLGTIEDVAGTNSFVGYYKQIVEAVRTKAPNSVIFCVSLYNNETSHHTYSDMISAIADLYANCFYIDYIGTAAVFTSSGSPWSRSGHFTTMGYRYAASVIYQLVCEAVEKNKSFFEWWGRNNLTEGQKYDFES